VELLPEQREAAGDEKEPRARYERDRQDGAAGHQRDAAHDAQSAEYLLSHGAAEL